ncbi:transposase [Streptomyces sp. MUM 203J]|nr:transposase [Streptomyces sp. MUM 203J]
MDRSVGQHLRAVGEGDGAVEVDVRGLEGSLALEAGHDVADLRDAPADAFEDVRHRVDGLAGLVRQGQGLGRGARLAGARDRAAGAAGEDRGQDVEGDLTGGAGGVGAPLVPGHERLAGLLHRGARVTQPGRELVVGKGRTWSRRGRTPLVRVTGKGSGRVLMAGLVCVRPGHETRLIYRTPTYQGRTGEKKGFRAREFADLITSARRRLGGAPLIVVWDAASTHHAKRLREFCNRNSDWLTIVKLPPYAPDLNPVEGVWAHLKKSLANLAPRTIDDLTPLVKNRLRAIQSRPQTLNGFIAETGLGLEPP